MSRVYSCKTQNRRIDVGVHPVLNGIDYLEVLDQDAPPGSPRQRTLLIHCLKDLTTGVDATKTRIDGGVRVRPIEVDWAARAQDAGTLHADGLIGTAERDFYLALADVNQVAVVRTNSHGDFSTYRLSLVLSSTDNSPLPGFDPVLSEIDFSFKVECPSEFDCGVAPTCPGPTDTEPALDHLAKDYASFRQLLLDRLAITLPDWKERSPADLGITLVELLAHAGDYLSYYQDATATEAYLATARRRTSARRHARLLDYLMHDGCNARVWVAFEIDEDADGLRLPATDDTTGKPTQLLSRTPESTVIEQEKLDQVRSVYAPETFELVEDLRLYRAHNRISFHTWSDTECCLPRGATRATLRDDTSNRLRLRVGDVLVFEEVADPKNGEPADADPSHRHALRLTRVSPEAEIGEDGARVPGAVLEDPLTNEPIVEIEWHEEDALPFPLCVSSKVTIEDGSADLAEVSVVRANVGLADHGLTEIGERLDAASGHLRYRPPLKRAHVTVREERVDLSQRSATASLRQEPAQALPSVELKGGGETWIPQRDLLASDRFAREFVVEVESDGEARLRFGDGTHGREPLAAVPLEATYRVGNGTAGNVGPEAVSHVVANLSGITRVRNPLAAAGGIDPERIEEARQYAPQAFRTQERAVTEADYAEMTQRHPQVQKAVATRRWTGSWHTIFVTVDRKGGAEVDAAFERELREFLERYRLTGHDLEVAGPLFVSLDIVLTVCAEPGHLKSDVKQDLLDTFSNRPRVNHRLGFFHPDRFTFGQPVYLSQIVATAMEVPGVRWVDADDSGGKANRFRRWGEAAHGEIAAGKIELGRLEIARLDNDPNFPENGRIDFIMKGGL